MVFFKNLNGVWVYPVCLSFGLTCLLQISRWQTKISSIATAKNKGIWPHRDQTHNALLAQIFS